jgi:hypothetical protein
MKGVDIQSGLSLSIPVYWGPQIIDLGCAPTPEAVVYVANRVTEIVAKAEILADRKTKIVFPKNPQVVQAPLQGVYHCWNGCDLYWDQSFIDELVQRISVHVLKQRAKTKGYLCQVAQIKASDVECRVVLDDCTRCSTVYKTAEDFVEAFGYPVEPQLVEDVLYKQIIAELENPRNDHLPAIGGDDFRQRMRPLAGGAEALPNIDPSLFDDVGDGIVAMVATQNPLPERNFADVHRYIGPKVNATLNEFYKTQMLGFTRIRMLEMDVPFDEVNFSVGEKNMLDACVVRCVRTILSYAWDIHKRKAVYVMDENGYSESFRTIRQARCAALEVGQRVQAFETMAYGVSDFVCQQLPGSKMSSKIQGIIAEKTSLMTAYILAQRANAALKRLLPSQTGVYVFSSIEDSHTMFVVGTGAIHGNVVMMNPEPQACCLVQ